MRELRCRAGDLARVVRAWNPALVGRIVLVGTLHSRDELEWNVTLLGEPGMTITGDRKRLGIGNNMLAPDWTLEPLRGDAPEVTEQNREVLHA